MGKIISPPKAPPLVVAAPVAPPEPITASAPEVAETPDDTAARARRADLLQRERGIFGTIQTGFRGLLGLASQGVERKTLLGE